MNMHYLVTAGEYSDYHVMAVFSDRKKAEKYAKVFKGDVEQWEDTVEVPRPFWWEARIQTDGTVVTYKFESPRRDQSQCMKLFRGKEYWKFTYGANATEGLVAYGETEEEAIKIASDAMAQVKATMAGIS